MKTIDYYMGLPYKLEIVPDVEEGGYVARYPELPGCISVGSTLEETVNHVLDAKKEGGPITGPRTSSPYQTDCYLWL